MLNTGYDRVLLRSDDSTHATVANHYVIVWKKAITHEAIAVLDRGLRELVAANPKGVGAMLIVEHSAVLPPKDVWQKIGTIMSRHPEVRGTATVFEGNGLKQALFRTVTTTVNLLTTKAAPADVFADVRAASDWLVKAAPGGFAGPMRGIELSEAVARLR